MLCKSLHGFDCSKGFSSGIKCLYEVAEPCQADEARELLGIESN